MEGHEVSFAEMLRRLRENAGLSQRALAARAGMSEDAVSSLERGVRSPRAETVIRLAQALRLGEQEREALLRAAGHGTGLLPPEAAGLNILEGRPNATALLAEARALIDAMPTDGVPQQSFLPAGSRMGLGVNPLFVGRGEELLQVAAALKGADATVALGQVVASTGLGGLGKTQLAAEFVHRFGRFFIGGVFWLSFASAEEIPLQVAACAGPAFEARSMEERLALVKSAWQSAMPRLLIFDNCEDELLLETWRPPSGGCRVLVTSRRSGWSPTLGVTALPLDLLPRADSIELLRRYRADTETDDPGLDAVANELGDLPLALHLAGSYLRAYRSEVSLDCYLAELQHSEVIQHASLLGAGVDDAPSPTHHVQSVAQTFALCLGRLDRAREADRVAIALLARMACMAPGEPVPRDLLAKTLDNVDPMLRADGLNRLEAVGLVEEGSGWLRLHRLLAHFVRDESLDPDARPIVEQVLIDCGQAANEGHLTGPALVAVLPHMIDVGSTEATDEPHLAALCNAIGLALRRADDLRSAERWLTRALEIREAVLGPDHPDTAGSITELANLLQDQGQLAAARPLRERAVAVRETLFGPDHIYTAASINDLAVVLWTQGEQVAARHLYERALAIREGWPDADPGETADNLNNLAVVLRVQGDLVAARSLQERALAIHERVSGADHPHTARVLNNLACVLKDLGELATARPLHERALAIRERLLGPDHRDVAVSLANLGLLLRAQGELAAARRMLARALVIREKVLGPDHPYTAISINSMALVLQDLGELAAARLLFERALDIRERVLGYNHRDTAVSLHDLALLLCDQGDPAAARPLFERALGIRERVLGPDHPDTVATKRALAEPAEGDGAATGA